MFFILSKTLDLLLSPLTWVIAMLVWGLLRMKRNGMRRTRLWVLLATALLAVSGMPVTSGMLFRSLERGAADTRSPNVVYDAVILLGGAVDGAPRVAGAAGSYNENIDRLIVTFHVLQSGQAKNAILSGRDEATIMKAQLMAWGIAEDRLILEERSMNTNGNAIESVRLAKEHGLESLLLVTSAYHMLRAEECFRARGVKVATLPVDYRVIAARNIMPRAAFLKSTEDALREYSGRVVYRVIGYAQPE